MKRFMPLLLLPLVLLTQPSPAVAADDEGKAPRLVVVKAARLIDGISDEPLRNAVIVIENDQIRKVGEDLPIPPGAEVIDLGGATPNRAIGRLCCMREGGDAPMPHLLV